MTSASAMTALARCGLVERMARREVHPPALVDDGGLQRLGELDEQRHAGRRARQPVGDDHRVLGGDQQPRQLRDGAESPCGGVGSVSFGIESLPRSSMPSSCSSPSATSTTGAIGGVIAIL